MTVPIVEGRLVGACPASAIPLWVGLAGFAAVLAAFAIVVGSGLAPEVAAILVVLAGGAPPVLHAAARLAASKPRVAPFDGGRVTVKLVGSAVTLGLVAAAVSIFPFFGRLSPLAALAGEVWPLLTGLWIAYLVACDRLSPDPEDGLHALGLAALGRPFDEALIGAFLKVLLIKLFFFALMFDYLARDVAFFREEGLPPLDVATIDAAQRLNRLVFALDTALAALGYLATLQVFGWHVRRTDPAPGGWIACLVCYEPFYPALTRAFLDFSPGGEPAFVSPPLLAVALLCNAVYLFATVAYGPLFSNLTRRGIITSGPYRLTKHPAYVFKVLGWWLFELPFMLAQGPTEAARRAVMLLGLTLIYVARARYEERMLREDPVYRAYSDHIRQAGAYASIRTFFLASFRRGRT